MKLQDRMGRRIGWLAAVTVLAVLGPDAPWVLVQAKREKTEVRIERIEQNLHIL